MSSHARSAAPAAAPGAHGPVWTSPENCYFAYPHANGFVSDRHLIISQQRPGGRSLRHYVWAFETNELTPLLDTGADCIYGDYCEATSFFYLVTGRSKVVRIRVGTIDKPETVVEPRFAPNNKLEPLVSVDPSGQKLLWASELLSGARHDVTAATLMETDLPSGKSIEVAALDFSADHQHYCPGDPRWIGFSHEGDVRASHDRMWAVHREPAKDVVKRIWNQVDANGADLFIGHERWAYHAAGALVVAYPGHGLSGTYFVDAAKGEAKLVSASDRDWHCNLSRDGTLAVVDTQPPKAAMFEADGRRISGIEVIKVKNGERKAVATAHAQEHPWHPHPHISPSGRFVVFNDYMADGLGTPSRVKVVQIA